jgi:uncharacterized protein
MNLKGKRALVTGASSGIGAEMAKLLAARGLNLVITARRADRLEALAAEIKAEHAIEVDVLPLDLSAPGAALVLYQKTEEAGKKIDVLINNAGFGIQSHFADCAWERTHQQLQLNIVALSELTWRFMNVMKTRGGGYILNVASIGAYIPSPYYAAYTAGKAYVRNFTEAVSYEAKASGVKITCLCPGPTDTEFLTTAGHKDLPAIGKLIFMSPKRCARIGLSALFGWRVNIISGWLNKLMMLALRLTPRWLMIRISAFTMGRHTQSEESG